MSREDLIKKALAVMANAYAPYSGYKVGAALLSSNGNVYLGCNVENAAFGPTNCAERSAFFSAVSAGEREFRSIAVVGGKDGKVKDYFYPCGVCRQVMAEFCNEDFEVIVAKDDDNYRVHTLGELLPSGFSPRNIEN